MAMDSVPPLIRAQLNYLLSQSSLSIKVERMWSGSRNAELLDRFTLVIPFCFDNLKWDIVYNAQYPLTPPDIIFGPEDEKFGAFLLGCQLGESKAAKTSLSDWNCKDPTRLLLLILELRKLYVEYQKKRVGEVDDYRLKFELSTILSREGIEMCVCSGTDKSEEVKFAVPLLVDMDINKLVKASPWRYKQKIYLQVLFSVIGKHAAALSLPRLKLVSSSADLKFFFCIDDMRLPPWLDGMCMAEYLPTLEEMLESQIKNAALSIDLRRKFITALASLLGRPVEADPVFCRKATFLTASGIFTFLVHFSLPIQFPKQQPVLTLQSSQHFNSQSAPIKSPPLSKYPWSPRWETSKMAERIYDFLLDECLNFKKYCIDSIRQQR